MRFQSICDGVVCQNKACVWQPGKKRKTFPVPAALTLSPLCPKVVGSRPLTVYYTGKPMRDGGVQRQRKRKNTISFVKTYGILLLHDIMFFFLKNFTNFFIVLKCSFTTIPRLPLYMRFKYHDLFHLPHDSP